ncbi:MAG: hypoxanthine phosphoribosyltransferase [Bacilli bacterium]|nr:hypoxanthine phosphoribosyltransferase [Bacilli bacterium]
MEDIVLTEQQIAETCARIGASLTDELKDEEKIPVLLGVMNGALPFFTDLIKKIDCHFYIDFIHISSYAGTKSTGVVQLRKDVSFDIEGRTVVVVEDIVDTGLSMEYLLNHVKSKKPKRIILVSLFDKILARKNDVKVDYAGVVLDEIKFLVGYGLDYNNLYRGTSYVKNLSAEEKAIVDAKLAKD